MNNRAVSMLVILGALLLPLSGLAEDDGGMPHGEFELDCEKCHSVDAWKPIRKRPDFTHREVGRPLEGSHKKVACRSCHVSLEFSHVGGACADCHRDVHNGEFGFYCERCHLPRSWDNRRRMWDDHAKTLFPLTGAHATLDCGVCHYERSPFQYALTPIDCFSCHADDYQQASDPNHLAAGFPTNCRICHGTASWDALGFPQHDAIYFPINSGTHAGEWGGCSDCHTMPGDFGSFECIDCHAHQQAEMDGEHDDVNGYVYLSSECYRCHPRGRAEDGDD